MFDQDPNEQANISGADFAIMCDEMAKLRADLAAALEMKRMLLEHNNTLTAERDAATLRADAAQEELRKAREQEPAIYVCHKTGTGYQTVVRSKISANLYRNEEYSVTPYYAAPVPAILSATEGRSNG